MFSWNGIILRDGDSLPLQDIGDSTIGLQPEDAGTALVCVTEGINDECCRDADGGAVGDWFFPDGSMVLNSSEAQNDSTFIQSAFTQQVRLNRKTGPYQYGLYTCNVSLPNEVGFVSASINLSESNEKCN